METRKIDIEIDAVELAELLIANRDKIGSTDWDVWVNESGKLDVDHTTYNHDDWYELIDLYSFWDDIGEDVEELAEFIKTGAVDLNRLEEEHPNPFEKLSFTWR